VTDTTFEEAKRCPSCRNPGREASTQRPQDLPRGTKVHVFVCEEDRCERVGERWLVQTNPDGSIPQLRKGPKVFSRPRESSAVMVRAREELAITDWLSTHPGATEKDARRALGGYERF
jgi:hypothetical protein